jgi:hypothetical protein
MSLAALWLIAALGQAPRLPRIDEVAWLRGCWETHTSEGTIEAQWLSPRASSILGVSRTIHGTTLVDYEMALIREGGDRLSYESHPTNDEPGLFQSIAIDDRRVVFENLKPRFPAHVGFELTAPDQLLAWADGSQNTQPRRVEYRYARVACAGE